MTASKEDIKAREKFSSRGKTYWLILRGRWGLNIDRHIVRWTGFSLITWQYAKAGGVPYRPVILLTTTGARTGIQRSSVLPFYQRGASFIIVGSNGGGPKDPNWTINLRAHPECRIRYKGRSLPMLAEVAAGKERARLLDDLAAEQPFVRNYDTETRRNGRELPLVVLTPRTIH
jgi:deazaflavin-dependent oxidoreductase (nitroreductase family)